VSDTLTGEDKRVKQEQENTNDNTELRNYLEAELKKADQEKAQQDTRAEGEAEANVVINADNGELTDEDLNEIKALLNSLLEE
jgi:regulator of protease activity HflC (stomatin/prohibitin superfamily)